MICTMRATQSFPMAPIDEVFCVCVYVRVCVSEAFLVAVASKRFSAKYIFRAQYRFNVLTKAEALCVARRAFIAADASALCG